MLQQMMVDDKEAEVREAVVRSLGILFGFISDTDKYTQVGRREVPHHLYASYSQCKTVVNICTSLRFWELMLDTLTMICSVDRFKLIDKIYFYSLPGTLILLRLFALCSGHTYINFLLIKGEHVWPKVSSMVVKVTIMCLEIIFLIKFLSQGPYIQ